MQLMQRPFCYQGSKAAPRLSTQPGTTAPVALRLPKPSSGVCAARRRREVFEEEDTSVGRVVEEATASSQGLFNDNFKNALSEALNRNGPSSLLTGSERMSDDTHLSEQEDILKTAVMSSKANLLKLQMMRSELEKAIEMETRQVERLLFALEKARNDAAYYRGVESMMDGGTSDS